MTMNYHTLADAIAGWLANYAHEAGASGYVLGLSGGVDSAVTAALCLRAVGQENVLGAILPCHSLAEDMTYAARVADALQLSTVTIDLSAAFDALMAVLPQGSHLARANVKPRLRMTTLYYLAQSRNALVAGTGNRPEMMVGYFTKYGDGGVDLEPLGELFKHEVRALGQVLGVPREVIERAPTAGLWPGQTDEAELGITYDELDALLLALEQGAAVSSSAATVSRVQRMIAASEHKRRPPPSYPVAR